MNLQFGEKQGHGDLQDRVDPEPGDMVENGIMVWADKHDNLFPIRTVGVQISLHTPMLYLGMNSWKNHIVFHEGRQLSFINIDPSGTFEKVFSRISSFCEAD